MRFFSVADRELRVTARRAWFYRSRWITALAFFGLLVWLAWVYNLSSNRGAAANLFECCCTRFDSHPVPRCGRSGENGSGRECNE